MVDESAEWREPRFTVDVSALDPAASVKEAERRLRESSGDDYLWCVYGEC